MTLPENVSDKFPTTSGRQLNRESTLALLKLALDKGEFRFARQLALQWIATYPGDLIASLGFARALIGEGQKDQAIKILKGLCLSAPEFFEAVELLATITAEESESKRTPDSDSDRTLFENWFTALSGSSNKQVRSLPAPPRSR